jgi:hypothetical protein
MFDLERAIAGWRQRVNAAGVKTGKILDELESHLRDELARQVNSGSSPEAAFELAVRKIGESDAIATEFEKAAPGKEFRERKIKLLCVVFTGLLYLLPFVLSIPKPWIGFEPVQRWLGIGAIVLTILSLFSGLLLCRILPVIPSKRARARIQFASVIPVIAWIAAFGFAILPRLDLTFGQVTVATLWAIAPLAIFGGLTFGLDEAAYRATS